MAERVLAIDDEYLVLQHIKGILESANYEVAMLTDSGTCLQEFYRVDPHLILLDLLMPGVDGYDVCAKLRAVISHPHHYPERAGQRGQRRARPALWGG